MTTTLIIGGAAAGISTCMSHTRANRTVNTNNGETISYDYLPLSLDADPISLPIEGIERALPPPAHRRRCRHYRREAQRRQHNRRRTHRAGNGRKPHSPHHRSLKVTVIERTPEIMPPLDSEMSVLMRKHLEAHGVRVLIDAETTAISEDTVLLADGTEIPADMVIASVDVRPASQLATKTDHNSGEDTLVPIAQTARTGMVAWCRNYCWAIQFISCFSGWNQRRAKAKVRTVRDIYLHPSDHSGYYPVATQLHFKLVLDAETDAILGAQAVS